MASPRAATDLARRAQRSLTWLLLAVTLTACAGSQPSPTRTDAPASSTATGSGNAKRMTIAIRGELPAFYRLAVRSVKTVPGIDEVENLVNAGLARLDNEGELIPELAEAVPSIDNGLWVLFPNGRMETTWKIRANARWHDGAPLTSDDLVFTALVGRDPDLPTFANPNYRFLDQVEAVDERTVKATWSQPFIAADTLFTGELGLPLPKHLLEKPYAEAKGTFSDLPHWSDEFISSGPFRVKEFARGSYVALQSFDGYVLGRPTVDIVEVKFIPDSAALVANVLAGAVEMTIGNALSIDQALDVRGQWRDGKVVVAPNTLQRLHPQLLNPSPAIIGNVQFRRAMMHAMDRQEIINALEGGLTTPPISFLAPNQPQHRDLESRVRTYEYDPNRAMQIIESLGYTRGPDGSFRDAAQERLQVEILVIAGDDRAEKVMGATSDFWQRSGVGVTQAYVSAVRLAERGYVAERKGFYLIGGTSDVKGVVTFHSSNAPTLDSNYSGNNHSRYISPEFDALVDRYVVTIPQAERRQQLGVILEHIADQLPIIPLYYRVDPYLIGNRLVNVTTKSANSLQTWNAYQWDVNER